MLVYICSPVWSVTSSVKRISMTKKIHSLENSQLWMFGEAFSCAFFFGSGVTERVAFWSFLSITRLRFAPLIEDLQGGGRALVSWTIPGVVLLPGLGSEVIERLVLRLWLSVTCLELSVLADGLRGGLELVFWTVAEVGFPPSFGDQGWVPKICKSSCYQLNTHLL